MSELKPQVDTLCRDEAIIETASQALDGALAESACTLPKAVRAVQKAENAAPLRISHDGLASKIGPGPTGKQMSVVAWDRTLRLSDETTGREARQADHGKQASPWPGADAIGVDAAPLDLQAPNQHRVPATGRGEQSDPEATIPPHYEPEPADATILAPHVPAVSHAAILACLVDDTTAVTAMPGERVRLAPIDVGRRKNPDAALLVSDAQDERQAELLSDIKTLSSSALEAEPPPSGEEITIGHLLIGGRWDATPDEDRTAITSGDFAKPRDVHILDPEAMEVEARTAQSSQTGASWPTMDDNANTGNPVPKRDLHSGDVLRGRFKLMSQLGEGGMGTVWKAIDLLKEEARDPSPFVAIKVLSGDFKEHPEAFISLQRESAKAQRLAHPNIATVYDFDRDDETVYMTMEVLEGCPLDGYIRKLPAGGLPEEEAMKLIEQLGAGLSYAHDHKLVHSDLKPGNAFLTKEGIVKLLDFGIARASKTKGDEEGETTVFDPVELGALTPAYATVEMFEGQQPDPRDDIYALAIIAYQLFTGKHPYGKLSAPKAKDRQLVPKTVAKLTRYQNTGLRRGLAFLREDRTPSVNQFLDDLRPKKRRATQFAAGSVAVLLVISTLVYNFIGDLIVQNQQQMFIDEITEGTAKTIPGTLQAVHGLNQKSQRAILENEDTKRVLIDYYRGRIEDAVNSSKGLYHYSLAQRQLAALSQLYPDSAEVFRMERELKTQKDTELNHLNDRYNEYLERGLVVAVKEQDDVTDVLGIIKQIDPNNHLLTDRRLTNKYIDLVRAAIDVKDFKQANVILNAGAPYVNNDDPTLIKLRHLVTRELERQREKR